MLKNAGVNRQKLMQSLQSIRGNQRVTDQDPEGKYQTLEKMAAISPSSRARERSIR